MQKTIILIPGAYPGASKTIFNAIKANLERDYQVVELDAADENDLLSKAKRADLKILIGKSLGGRIAIDYQLENKDLEALILLAPASKPDKRYRNIEIPVLIVHGTKDDTIPIDNSREMKKYFKNSRLIEILGVGHGYEGKESETAKIILKWINSL